MQISLQGKKALVTGASRGIGKAIARALASAGAEVVGTATTEQGAAAVNQALGEFSACRGMVLDVSEKDSIAALFAACKDSSLTFDILVNNAGITRDNLMLRMSDDEWQQVINTNLSSVYHMIKGVLRSMTKARSGRIINISSVVATTGNPGQVNYVASKAGIEAMTKTLARELGSRNVLVNSVAPGFIATDMTESLSDEQKGAISANIPLARMGQAEDIANAVVYLCSEQASYITGQTLHVNGGMA